MAVFKNILYLICLSANCAVATPIIGDQMPGCIQKVVNHIGPCQEPLRKALEAFEEAENKKHPRRQHIHLGQPLAIPIELNKRRAIMAVTPLQLTRGKQKLLVQEYNADLSYGMLNTIRCTVTPVESTEPKRIALNEAPRFLSQAYPCEKR